MLDQLFSTPTSRGWAIAQALLVHPGFREGASLHSRKTLYKSFIHLMVAALFLSWTLNHEPDLDLGEPVDG